MKSQPFFNEADISVRIDENDVLLKIIDPDIYQVVLSPDEALRLAKALTKAAKELGK